MDTSPSYNPNLPPDHQDSDTEDIRQQLYELYGNHVFESMEQFCHRQADLLGEDWIYKLSRR